MSLSLGVLQSKYPTFLLTLLTAQPTHPPKSKRGTPRAHAPTQRTTHPETMMIVSAKDDYNPAWASESTSFGYKIMDRMGWKDGGF